jgi:hypothetical protein
MEMKYKIKLHKALSLTLLIGLIVISCFGAIGSQPALAQGAEPPTPGISISTSAYFTSNTIVLGDGTSLDEYIINGPPHPPSGDVNLRPAVELPQPNHAQGIVTLNVPVFKWSFGCSATSGAMIAAYWDRNGFPNIYTGPTNGGIMPMDSSSWPNWMDGTGTTYAQCPLTASHQGLDGRATRGSIDDYWVSYLSSAQDPYLTNGWAQHSWGDAIGDYMKTSQSAYSNPDGSTIFYTWTSMAAPLTCADMETNNITRDGTYGRKLFYEAKGYTVTDCYNQKTDNNGGGFTFALYKAQIDAGRPVMLNLAGHTIVGVGYDDSTNTVYIHDTWDYLTHTMPWGGSYENMALRSVSIVNFAATCNTPTTPSLVEPANGATTIDNTPYFSWSASTNANLYDFMLDDNADFSSPIVNDLNTTTSSYAAIPTLADGTYYWKVRGHNTSAGCNVYGSWTAPWSFTVNTPPGDFNKSAPANGATSVPTSPTLSWGASTGATSYEYCYDTTNDNACTGWTSNGTATSKALSGLNLSTTYYWQARAYNGTAGPTLADAGTFWSFTTGSKPGAFNKTLPVNGATDLSSPTLTWGASSGATSYEYCYDTTNDNACSAWTSNGTATTKTPNGLIPNTTYYWHVRAVNSFGTTYANGDDAAAYWSFSTGPRPGSFGKTSPANGAIRVPTSPTLTWGASIGATSYEYCYDTTNANNCSSWTSNGTATRLPLSGLGYMTTYYWHIRAVNGFGTTHSDGDSATAFWAFTVVPNFQFQVFVPTIKK